MTTIKINTIVEKEIDLPKYFTIKGYDRNYFMLINEKTMLRMVVRPLYNQSYVDGPDFTVSSIKSSVVWFDNEVVPITHDEFFDAVSEFHTLMSSIINYGH